FGEQEVDRSVEDDVATPKVDREHHRGHDHDDSRSDDFVATRPGHFLHLRQHVFPSVADGGHPLLRLTDDLCCGCLFHRSICPGRPRGARTPNLRFWRPLLYQLSYWPECAARGCKNTGCPTYSLISLRDARCACGRDGRTSSSRASPSSSACSWSSSNSDVCTRCIAA